MPQRSHGFAVGRVRAKEINLLSQSAIERLLAASDLDELCRLIAAQGWGEAKGDRQIDVLCQRHVEEAARLIKDDSPEPLVTDCMLLKYDVLNLKVLLKSRALGIAAEGLSGCGTLDPERLSRAVAENSYGDLPPALRDAMIEIEKRIAVKMDPLFVDARLDRAMYLMIDQNMAGVKDAAVRRYFETRADFTNILIALRAHAMGRGAGFAAELFVAGGRLPLPDLERIAEEPQRIERALEGRDYLPMMREAVQEGGSIAKLEKRMDDYLLALIKAHRYETQSVLPLMGYLLAREREAAAVRLIATAKQARVSPAKLAERLRELYA